MPITLKININKNTQPSPPAKFDPNPLAASARDQIFWTNNDSVAHWPGLLKDDGSVDQMSIMPNQIAPNGDTSQSFSPSSAATLKYACSIHPTEQGTINVT